MHWTGTINEYVDDKISRIKTINKSVTSKYQLWV